MHEILVQLREPTDKGRLHYFRNPQVENHLIFIESLIRRKMEYAITAGNGPVVLFFDADRCLINVEVIFPRRAWRLVPRLETPNVTMSADIALVGVRSHYPPKRPRMKRHHWIRRRNGFCFKFYQIDNMSTTVYSTSEYTHAQILFDDPKTDAGWVALSEQCSALIIEDRLKGFFVKLAGAPLKDYSQSAAQQRHPENALQFST